MKSKFQGDVLSKSEMKNIKGGNVPPPTPCVSDGYVCYTSGEIQYKCHAEWEGEEVVECCCGHYLGDDECYAT